MSAITPNLRGLVRRARLAGRRDDAAAVERLFWLLHEPPRRPGLVQWRNRPLRYADGPALYRQLAEIFADRCFDFGGSSDEPRILDVGGHVGLATLRLRELFPRAHITSFEPDPQLAAMLRANLAAAGDRQTHVLESAASVTEGRARFAATGGDNGMLATTGSIEVATVDLARFCEEPIDFLKLDVEGAEFELLHHLHARQALRNIARLAVELHAWTPGLPRFHEALALLAAEGFNYRLRGAAAFGAERNNAFTGLPLPANLVTVHAWREAE